MPDLVGQTLDNRYYLLAKLGEGSIAAVYRAEDLVRGCLVAAKVMKPHQLGDAVALKPLPFFEICAMRADGSSPVNLTNHPGADVHPAWTR